MLEHTLSIGMNDKDTLKQELTEKQFIDCIVKVVGDCTIQNGLIGVFTNSKGEQTVEKSLQVKIFGRSKKDIINCVKQLCIDLNQESIIHECKQSRAMFISA